MQIQVQGLERKAQGGTCSPFWLRVEKPQFEVQQLRSQAFRLS